MSDTLSTAQSSAIKLGLRTGTPPKQLTLLERLHFWLVLVAPREPSQDGVMQFKLTLRA